MKTTSESLEKQFDLSVDCDDLLPATAPIAMKPHGLGFERQQYLHKNIQTFVKECFQDMLCPPPPERDVTSVPVQDRPLPPWQDRPLPPWQDRPLPPRQDRPLHVMLFLHSGQVT